MNHDESFFAALHTLVRQYQQYQQQVQASEQAPAPPPQQGDLSGFRLTHTTRHQHPVLRCERCGALTDAIVGVTLAQMVDWARRHLCMTQQQGRGKLQTEEAPAPEQVTVTWGHLFGFSLSNATSCIGTTVVHCRRCLDSISEGTLPQVIAWAEGHRCKCLDADSCVRIRNPNRTV